MKPTRTPIRNYRSSKPLPPRCFDVVVEDNKAYLEVKVGKDGRRELILWKDVVAQVQAALTAS